MAENSETGPMGAGLANLTGRQIGRYLVGQRLGSGGAATVYRAYDQVQGTTVALKLLLPGADEKTYGRFRREATLAGALRHPHIVRILQIGVAPMGEVAYIAMELVEGESLADLLAQRGRLRPEETANLLEPIARALAYAHSQGVVHRDVKPGNILLRPASPGAPGSVQLESLDYPVVPLLSDFGIARALDAPELTSAGRTVGTPAYMAPEQCAGSREVDGRADIYSLGAVLYRTIAGRLPFNGTTTQILHAHVYEPLTIDDAVLRLLSPLMVEVIQRCMAKQPEARYASATELADALVLAAGRLPPRPGTSAGETTATLTLSSLPSIGRVSAAASTVLVPGMTSAHVEPSAPGPTAAAPAAARTTVDAAAPPPPGNGNLSSRLERLNWPGIALAAVLGVVILAIGLAFGVRGPGLWDRLGGAATPTAGAVLVISPTPVLAPALGVTITATASPTAPPPLPTATIPVITVVAPTSASSATPLPTPAPIPTDTPAPPPTSTDTPAPTPTSTATVTPTATPAATVTPTSTAAGPDPTQVACLALIDERLRAYVQGLTQDQQAALGCPQRPAVETQAWRLSFDGGFVTRFDAIPSLIVEYTDTGQWELLGSTPLPPQPPEEFDPGEGRFVPTGVEGAVWASDGRRDRLGYALTAEPEPFAAIYQEFPGALLIFNRNQGNIIQLPANLQQ